MAPGMGISKGNRWGWLTVQGNKIARCHPQMTPWCQCHWVSFMDGGDGWGRAMWIVDHAQVEHVCFGCDQARAWVSKAFNSHIVQLLEHSSACTCDTSGGLYLPQYNPYGIHLESMESMLAETTAKFIVPWTSWIPCGMIMECRHIHQGFHGTNPYGINDHYTIRIHINSTRNYWVHS